MFSKQNHKMNDSSKSASYWGYPVEDFAVGLIGLCPDQVLQEEEGGCLQTRARLFYRLALTYILQP